MNQKNTTIDANDDENISQPPIMCENRINLENKISLLRGDCLTLMKNIPDKSIDMILCDLPYGTTQNNWDCVINLEMLWEQYERIIKNNGCIALFSQTPFDKILGNSNLKMLKYEWIWVKTIATGHLNAKKMPMKKHENILIFYKNLPIYNPQWTYSTPYQRAGSHSSSNYGKQKDCVLNISDGRRYPVDVVEFKSERGFHPTQKPVALLEYLIKTYTNEGETVLDNCMGAGSTGVACVRTGRKFIGIELEKQYYDIAFERIHNELRDQT